MSDSAELLDCLFDGAEFLDEWVHRVFRVIELLREYENLRRAVVGDDDDPILVGDNNVAGVDAHAVAVDRDVHAGEVVVAYRGRRNGASRVDGKADLFELRQVAHTSVDDGSGKAS